MEKACLGNVWAGLSGEPHWTEQGWFATFTCSYFCCNNQLPNNLIQGTRGENHLSFHVQWSEVQWLIANVFTARWEGLAEGLGICFEKRKKADNVERQRKSEPGLLIDREAKHSHKLQKPTTILCFAFSRALKVIAEDLKVAMWQVICFSLVSPRSQQPDEDTSTYHLFGR